MNSPIVTRLLFLLSLLSLSFGLVIQFDGSLRKIGGKRNVASCGAAILQGESNSIIAMGGKKVTLHPGTSVADVEYEGLLIGMEYLLHQTETNPEFFDGEKEIVIRGDCRPIFDQLKGTSTARKAKFRYEKARAYWTLLEERCQGMKLVAEHVPRAKNRMTNCVCRGVFHILNRDAILHAQAAIRDAEAKAMPALVATAGTTNTKAYKRHKNRPPELEESPFGSAIEFITDGIIHDNHRLSLLRDATNAATRAQDPIALYHIGLVIQKSSKNKYSTLISSNHESFEAAAITMQVQALHDMGLPNAANRLEHKRRFLLNQHSHESLFPHVPLRPALRTNDADLEDLLIGTLDDSWMQPFLKWHKSGADKLAQAKKSKQEQQLKEPVGVLVRRPFWREFGPSTNKNNDDNAGELKP
eukprot:CAMPEP_0118678018 /NCGR_PEP_ID=MMETSP0800-20121206/2967_1 /TAXON_ID=210618 ORGANISM="Striatella unipunctata, Strain CCMP2910" /NCGR_SAMPLE_ID=MMETSP0800 /ASSEMBLY_ACC=CAM_ASM_000638 /LENGTH=413 /DNA_ID=CAMNT_0006573791 /DNA_START=48 /DNA_END=1289 /DNA_ORIENTATION=+